VPASLRRSTDASASLVVRFARAGALDAPRLADRRAWPERR
jgi:hypothetical protein